MWSSIAPPVKESDQLSWDRNARILSFMRTSDSQHISILVNASPHDVYSIARDVEYLQQWAIGLSTGKVEIINDDLLELDTPMGPARTEFVPRNDSGILDHTVTLPNGIRSYNPLRVTPHPYGAELTFTVMRLDSTEAEFERDCALVQEDLRRLALLVEAISGQSQLFLARDERADDWF